MKAKIKLIIALAALAAIGVQAGNIATDGVIGNITVGAGDYWQPGVGVGSMNTIINDGITLAIEDAAYDTIIQQNASGTSSITINPGGTMDFSNASSGGASLILGNVANNHGIINLAGGTFGGSGLTAIAIGRSGGTGEFNISAGTATFGVAPGFGTFGGGSGFIDFPTGSTGILTIAGANQTYYESIYASGNLTYNGSNAGSFTNYFQTIGEELALKGVITLPEPPPPIAVDLVAEEVTVSWPSSSELVYDLEGTSSLEAWMEPPLVVDISEGGPYTIWTEEGPYISWTESASPVSPQRFYRYTGRSLSRSGLTAISADGTLNLDRSDWLARNNLIYNSPPTVNIESIPLGSGKVGTALWIDPVNGLTAHLNRTEGVPAMSGIGMLRIPSLAGVSSATDYQGTLSIAEGIFTQQADGLTVSSFFRWGGEELVIDVQGANPNETITVELSVYSGGNGHGSVVSINPTYAIASDIPANEATGVDCIAIAGGDGTTSRYPGFRATQFFTAKAVGRNVIASSNASGAALTFNPNLDGSYRVVVPIKIWTGSPIDSSTLKPEALAAVTAVSGLVTDSLATLTATQATDFGAMWDTASLIRFTAADDSSRTETQYIEQMLALDNYIRISAALTPLPAVGGGETRLFCWNAVGRFTCNNWYQNLRPVNYANISSGIWTANTGTWDWLLDLLPGYQQHVLDTFPGYEGAGYPEYLDGQPGTTQGSLLHSENWNQWDIATPGTRWYTGRQMSTTLEMVAAILSEYDYRQDANFLTTYWPAIREGMLFHRSLLMDGGLGGDGLYHYLGVNSRENNWDDDDDTPDVSNMRYLLPIVIDFAQQRGDTDLVTKLNDLVGKLPEVATTTRTHPVSGLSVDAIAYSAVSRSPGHNFENADLDAIWPANLYGDESDPADIQLANDTLDTRIFKETLDWHPTSVQAARMGRTALFKEALLGGISRFMTRTQGFSTYRSDEVDSTAAVETEFTAIQTLGTHEALVQNYDGLLRIANAWPAEWEAIAWLPTEGGHRVTVEVVSGEAQVVVVDLGSTDPAMRIRNPWLGETFTVTDLTNVSVLHSGAQDIATVAAATGHRLLIERTSQPLASLLYDPVTDHPNMEPNKLGSRQLGKP